jgi:MFS family permease
MTDSRIVRRNRLSGWRFVLAFGVVSMLADFVYEGARSVTGAWLATFGASAALVGLITGFGEAAALVLRLVFGPLADRTHRYWALSITGYAITIVAVPLLALCHTLAQSATCVIAERFGKAVRTPAKDTMLAAAGTHTGRGKAFAIHEAMDQSGALLGPLLVAAAIALSGYRLGFAVLAIPGALALLTLFWLRRAVPRPSAYEDQPPAAASGTATTTAVAAAIDRLPGRFWLYTAFTAVSMSGFATFGVLSYHLQVRHIVAEAMIPLVYAAAMAAAAVTALASGHLYDRIGLGGLIVALPLTAAVPALSFATHPAAIWAGATVWGAAMGIHESTLRAAVADLVPPGRRGTGYGIFAAAYGLAWLAGSTIIGAIYSHSTSATITYTLLTQTAALAIFSSLVWTPRHTR